nr:MAG TPA: hypothetical protein [Caudoviricetes sp.]
MHYLAVSLEAIMLKQEVLIIVNTQKKDFL